MAATASPAPISKFSSIESTSKLKAETAEVMEDEIDYESIPNSSLFTNLIAGSIAGITEHTVMYPFDSIKVRISYSFSISLLI